MNGTKRIVYGILDDNLVFLPEDVAKAYASDHSAIWQLKTYGDARRFNPQGLNVAPGLDEDDYDEIPADEDAYDVTLTNEYVNGDWPPSAATIALDHLADDLDDLVVEVEHLMDPPTLELISISEADLVKRLKERGYVVRRDDDLIGRI
jgi:hypothetical protein